MAQAQLKQVEQAEAGAEERVRAADERWVRFKVDLWATDLNDVEIGIMKDTQLRAESRQFTKDMEVIGQITEDGERSGIIGWREGLWRDEEGMKRRLVLKLFSEKMNWQASLDLLLGRSLQLTHAAGVATPAYAINIARHDQMVQLERSAMKLPLFTEKFSFFVLNDDGPAYYRLRRKRFAMSADYELYNQRNQKVGDLDGQLVNLGGAWKVKLKASEANAQLEAVLKLFCAMLRFNAKARGQVAKLYGDIERGRADPKLDSQEDDFYMNPRRVR